MSIVKIGDLDARHSVQPVVPRRKGMETVDREAAALRIDAEVAAVRQGQVIPAFRGYMTADTNPALVAADREEQRAAEAEQVAD